MTNIKRLKKLAPLLILVAIIPIAYTSVFVYYPVNISVIPVHPPVIFQKSEYPFVCTQASLSSREAIIYTDFETYPLTGWTSDGGSWSLSTNGYKGNALQGADNNGGLGGASHYYSTTSVSNYTSLWIVVRTKIVSGTGWYGIAMFNKQLNRLYTTEIHAFDSRIEVWSYRVSDANNWYQHDSASISGYNSNNWYTIIVNYARSGTTFTINAYVYDANGNQVASLSTSIQSQRVFTPSYIGVEVDNALALFDDFIISRTDPRTVTLTNIPGAGYSAYVYDTSGNPVGTAISSGSTVSVSIVSDPVVGTGNGGKIVVRFPNGYICVKYDAPLILGGDTYQLTYSQTSVSLGAASASAIISTTISGSSSTISGALLVKVFNNDSKPYNVHLLLNTTSSQIPTSLTANITLDSATPIQIQSGNILKSETDWIQLSGGTSLYIYLTGYFTSTNQNSAISLSLEYCEVGVCVRYPVQITLHS